MRRILLCLLLLAGLVGTGRRVGAFTLVGELPAWFTDNTGLFPNGDIYGPMNLGEEYRWPVPVLNYAFDESFLNYFGQRGVDEVEKAIKILNDVPAMSKVDLGTYPLHTLRVNYRARDLGMMDVKTYVLKALLEQLGLGTPGRFVFTLRARNALSTPPITNYAVMMRNFDPETWMPTPYINGNLWTYSTIYDNQDSPTVKSTTVTEPVDPLILAEPIASLLPGFSFSVYSFGSFATGLTRDDVGGLRYIYRPENRNVETLPADASGIAGFGGGGGSTGGEGAWVSIPVQSTNTTTGGTTGGTTTSNSVFYAQALRGGVDKITFQRGPMLYQASAYSVTNRYTETIYAVVTNGVQRSVNQRVTRVLTVPDILFTAADFVNPDATYRLATHNDVATSNDGINGNAALDGPGQFGPTVVVGLNKVGPFNVNSAPRFLGQPSVVNTFYWSSFDGSTNDPVVYPTGTSIRDVERAVFGSR